jgi:hypothetical protein
MTLQSSRTSKRAFAGDIDGFSGVAQLPPDAAEIDPVEDHHQVRRLDLDMTGRLGRGGREPEAPFFEPFVPKDISVGIPISILVRSPRRLRKTKRCPENGSRAMEDSTR